MRYKKYRGFTLIELMVTLVLVAIIAAVTVPKLMEVNSRGHLEDVVNLVERTAARTKALALKTRLATVMEIRSDTIWINQLQGVSCESDFMHRCVHNTGEADVANDTNVIAWNEPIYRNSGVIMCDLRIGAIGADGSTACSIANVDLAQGGALCYNGSGQLWVRNSVDPNTACDATTPPLASSNWMKACAPWASSNNNTDAANTFSGVDMRFNRFENATGTCPAAGAPTGVMLGVTRQVLIPAGGHPLVRIP